jgi:hypothetical protein
MLLLMLEMVLLQASSQILRMPDFHQPEALQAKPQLLQLLNQQCSAATPA